MAKCADIMPKYLELEFDLDSTEACSQFQAALVEASIDDDYLQQAAEKVHHKLCEALTKPLKASQRFIQCLTESMAMVHLPVDVVMQNKAFKLSMDQDGSRLVQAALQVGDRRVQTGIILQLQGRVCKMMGSPHANHVLQRIIELLPPQTAFFIFDEVSKKWNPDYLAQHRFGCRVLERMIEHFPCSHAALAPWAQYLDWLLQSAASHCYHDFASFIMQHLMEHGTDEHRSIIAAAVAQELERAALDCHASGVLDKAFCFLPTHEQFNLASKVLEIDGLIGRMAASQRPAAERLLRVVSGTALMTEAQRQVNNAFPDTAEQSKVLKSLFGSSWWANMVGQFDASAVPEPSNVLAAPTPLMMISEDSCDVMSAPQQQSMMLSTGFRQNEVDEMPWWATTTSQVLSQWSKEHEEHEYFLLS